MCKGTTNWEDVYIVKKSLIPKETLEKLNVDWVTNHGGIPVDACIGKEIEGLIMQGIVTVGSCCGHEKWNANALILHSEKEKVERLGYHTEPFSDYCIKINLKTGTQI